MSWRRFRHAIRAAVLVLFAAGALAAFSLFPLLVTGQESDGFSRALKLARDIGRYSFHSDVEQTLHPTERPENIGRRASTQSIALGGTFDHAAESMHLQFWPYGAEINQSLEMKIENGRTYGRADEHSDWLEMEGSIDVFAPSGDPMGMLEVAENVHLAGADEETLFPGELLPDQYNAAVTRYLFDLNGLRFAQILRSQMEAELRRRGELPPGMNLRLAGQYVDMVGRGELWVDGAGLPLRQILHIEFPPEAGDLEWVEADIVTDFSDWRPHEVSLLSLDWRDPGMAAASYLRLNGLNPATLADQTLILGFVLLMTGFAALSLLRRRARVVQAIYSFVFITAIVGTPLLQSNRLAALDSRLAEQRALDEAEQADTVEVAAERFNPHNDPLLQGNDALFQDGVPVPRDPKDPASGNSFAATAVNVATATECPDVTPTSDCDGDGLLDNIEIHETGTWINTIDTDNDGISDKMEIQPFNVGSRTWHLNPRNPDSNGDGQPDTLECIGRVNVKPDGTLDTSVSAAACVDTDSDGVPDVYDFDDDADGVPDEVDDARLDYFTANNQTFDLALKGLKVGKSVLVDFSIRPTDSDHLWWTNSEMNWPSNDRHGQVMNVLDQNLPRSQNNMMLSALLEISMPYSDDNPSRGLPVKSSVTLSTIEKSTPIENWLDKEALDVYNITVAQDTTSGVLTAYVPLSLTRDNVGNTPVAWNGRMYYQLPSGATGWGDNHTVRMLWAVNMMNDDCEVPEGSTQTWKEHCKGNDHWKTSQSVVQMYYDDFIVTGLDLTEDHNVDGLAIAQQPGVPFIPPYVSSYYDNFLWHLADTLDETFLGAQTVNGKRFTVDDIAERTPRWGIPANNLYIKTYDNRPDMTTYLSETTGDEFIINYLKTAFPNPQMGRKESVLFVAERTLRAAGLSDGASFSANTFALDLSSIKPVTVGLMRWQPYVFDHTGWAAQDLPTYQETLGNDLKSVFTEGVIKGLAGTDTNYDFARAQAGAILLAQSYYAGVSSGSVVLLDDGSGPLSTGPLNDADHAMPAEPAVSIASNLLSESQKFYARLSLDNLGLSTTDGEIQTVAAATWVTLARARGFLMESLGAASLGQNASSGGQATWQLDDYTNMTDFKSPSVANSYQYLSMSLVGTVRQDQGDLGAFGAGIYELGTAVFRAKSAYSNLVKFSAGEARSAGQLKSIISDNIDHWAWIGWTFESGKAVGFFIYDLAAGKIRPDTPAFSQKLAETIADIIVQTIILVLQLASASALLGAVLAIISLVDAIAGLICDAEGVKPGSKVDKWVCGGITQDLVQGIALIINDTTPLADLTHSGRLSAGLRPPELAQRTATPGIAAGNQITMTGIFTSSLYFSRPHWMGYLFADTQLQDPDLRETTIKYEFQSSKRDINQELNGTNWDHVGGSGTYKGIPTGERYRYTFTTAPGVFNLGKAGTDQAIETYLAEGFGMNEQDCWLIVTDPICSLRTYKDTNHSDLTNSFVYDIFPETIDEFRALTLVENNHYRLAWDSAFPPLNDADGDGVPRSSDPDDSRPDTDADGLSDFFENQHSLPVGDPDIDADGLTDYWEVFYKTDPRRKDSDGDGLWDSEEVFHPNWIYPYENSALSNTNPPANAPSKEAYAGGWEFVYAFNGATPLKMLVTADPLDPDTDDDTIDDLREEEYGYNPRVASALKILGLATEVSATKNSITYPVPYATLDSDLNYTAVISNELNSRFALGLLQTELPEDTVRANQELGVLKPLGRVTMSGSRPISEAGLSASGTTSMTIRSGAIINEGTGRLLWMHMNEPAGATTFVDSSYQGYRGVCISTSTCPTTNGQYWQMDSNNIGAVIPSDDDIIMTDSGFTVATWIKPGSTGASGDFFYFDAFNLLYSSSGDAGWVSAKVEDNGSTLVPVASGQWSHLVVTYQPTGYAVGTLKIHVNGHLKHTTENFQGNVSAHRAYIHMGWFDSQGSMSLKELEIFPNVFTDTQVKDLYGRPDVQIDFAVKKDLIGSSTVTCSGSRCPTVSSGGATFDQKQNLTLTGGDGLDFSGNAFSISTWIRPKTRSYPFNQEAVDWWNQWHPLDPQRAAGTDWQGVFGSKENQSPPGTLTTKYAWAPTLFVNERGQMRLFMGTYTSEGITYTDATCHYDTQEGLITYDTWQHVNIVYDGTRLTFYINGVKVETNAGACANAQLAGMNSLEVGRPNREGFLYLDHASLISYCRNDPNSSDLLANLGINYDSILNWSKSFTQRQVGDININMMQLIEDDMEHTFRYFEDPPVYYPANDRNSPSYYYQSGLSNRSLRNASAGSIRAGKWCPPTIRNITGSFTWSMSNDFFAGSLNDFRIFRRSISDDEAFKIYRSSSGLFFLLDEPPGSSVFDDAFEIGTQGICSGDNCPDSGVGGIANQAAYFDGDDYLRIVGPNFLRYIDNNFTVAAWIKPDNPSGYQRIVAAELSTSPNGFGFGLKNQSLLLSIYGQHEFLSSATVTPGVWQHVAASYVHSGSSGTVHFWVNGELVDSKSAALALAPNNDDIYRIGSSTKVNSTATSEGFEGLIDEVVVLNRTDSDGSIVRQLRDRAPVMNLHLDEDFRSDSFQNDGQVNTPASGSAGAGDKGQVREAATFNGGQRLTVPANDRFNNADYSVGLWVKPMHKKGIVQRLITKENSQFHDANFRLWMFGNSFHVRFDKQYECKNTEDVWLWVDAATPLLENEWNHVMAVHDSQNRTMTLYINGEISAQKTDIDPSVCTDSQSITMGHDFSGSMDEVAYWSTALSSHEVAGLFDYQSRWFDIKETHVVKVDNDNPSVSLDLQESYLAPGSQIVGVTATDPTSSIAEVAYRIGSSGSYQVLTPTNGKWTFTLDVPESPNGILIQLRAKDSVGRQAFSSNNFFNIDYRPPEIAHVATPFTILDNTKLDLNATIVDSEAGVDKGSVKFALRDRNGFLIAPQIPGVLDESAAGFKCGGVFCNWKAQFAITQPLYGEYTVEVTAADIFGNSISSVPQPFVLDTIGPHADVVLEAGTPITPGLILKGVASDIEHLWSNRTLHLHFEEEIDDYTFVDPSKNEMIATCDTRGSNNDKPLPPGQAAKCPTAAQAGKYGGAASFDGVDDRLIIQHPVEVNNTAVIDVPVSEQLGLYNGSFTVMAWINGSNWSGDHAVLGTDTLVSNEGLLLGLRDGKPLMSFYNNETIWPTVLPTGEWHHLAWRYDVGTGEQAIYWNGLLTASDTSHAPFVGTDTLYVGRAAGADDFGGLIDELVVYPIPLTSDQIFNIVNPVGAAILDVEVRLRHIDDQGIADGEGVWHQAQLTPAPDFTQWQFTVPDTIAEGSYKIDTRATDSLSAATLLNAAQQTMDGESLASALATAERDNVRHASGVYVGYFTSEPIDRPPTLFYLPLVGRP